MTVLIRQATAKDAAAMMRILNEIIEIGGTTAFKTPFDEAGIMTRFVALKTKISCVVAEVDGTVIGFQSLEWSDPDATSADTLPLDWAIIATFVAPNTHKSGIGRKMFAVTNDMAKQASVTTIDATIRLENTLGQGYYSALGFTDYNTTDIAVSKRFEPI
ncbi:GNAT family N-acetyltransferase [Cochlodiniinecator piscidefendens]|uniref:GNAT family N-acetyltransferase n=1 Tax=Cochlodiniinecator piscidefendens TaxID=2715756 RepID=UPI00140B7455|nr:GNAT family N-acetyltransferase [Cochlodiniinecator piscidefendens]